MLLRTFVSHRFSGAFLRWTLIKPNRGEALGGTSPLRCPHPAVDVRRVPGGGVYPGCTGVYMGVYTTRDPLSHRPAKVASRLFVFSRPRRAKARLRAF